MDTKFHEQDLSSSTFLVTGGAGFIGSHIAEYLLTNGAAKVRVLDNLATGSTFNLDVLRRFEKFEFLEGDIRNLQDCRRACDGIDFISHQAALGSVPRSIKDPATTNDVNSGGFVNMAFAAAETGVKKFVYASSSSVYGDEPSLPKTEERLGNCLSPYAVSKKTNELYATVFGNMYSMPFLGFRYFNVFGPRQSPEGQYAAVIPLFISAIMSDQSAKINGDGEQTRDFTYVENAVQVNVRGMLSDDPRAFNQVYNVAVGENFSINFLYQSILEHFGKKLRPDYMPPRAGDIRNSLADISKAQSLLRYQPTFSFTDGLKKTIEYFQFFNP